MARSPQDDGGIRDVIVGTAGHIDHGKSSIVRRLTGVDPDRLAEERERGMTIDLGFAPYEHRSGAQVGIIDVPGHERFIKNMVAGATSVDVVMLVVAADDGVMPQTREHLLILDLLGAHRGLVVVTKIDLVEQELRELAVEEIREFLAAGPLEGAPLVAVSSETGEGFDTLRSTLDRLIDAVPARSDEGPFRMPVQRVFSAKGHGTVVTGVPVSGRTAPGDVLEVVGGASSVRVRAVHAYGRERGGARSGHSAALNVGGVSVEDVRRGDVVAEPGIFAARSRLSCAYRHVSTSTPLRNNLPVRVHVGTAEAVGRAVVLDADAVQHGAPGFVQLRLDSPVVAAPGDRFLLRHETTLEVLGGGEVLGATEGRLKRYKDHVLDDVRRRQAALGDPLRLARAALAHAGPRGLDLAALARETGLAAPELRERLQAAIDEGDVVAVGGDGYVDADALEAVADDLVRVVAKGHKARPLLDWLDIAGVRAAVAVAEPVLQAALARDARLETAPGGKVRRRGHTRRLSAEQDTARARLLEALADAGASPPDVTSALTGLEEREHRALVEMMRASDELVAVGPLLYRPDTVDEVRATLRAHARERSGEIDIPALRDELGTTRKYMIPLLEHFDAEGLTVRHGDVRRLRRQDTSAP